MVKHLVIDISKFCRPTISDIETVYCIIHKDSPNLQPLYVSYVFLNDRYHDVDDYTRAAYRYRPGLVRARGTIYSEHRIYGIVLTSLNNIY